MCAWAASRSLKRRPHGVQLKSVMRWEEEEGGAELEEEEVVDGGGESVILGERWRRQIIGTVGWVRKRWTWTWRLETYLFGGVVRPGNGDCWSTVSRKKQGGI